MKETKIKYEEVTINFRINKTLKNNITQIAVDKNVTVSKYLRALLESVHDGSYGIAIEDSNAKNKFLFSKEFLRLVVWIFIKKDNYRVLEIKGELNGYIRTLKRIEDNLPFAIVQEFDKVLFDLLRVIKIENTNYERFEFAYSHIESKKFNFDILKAFLLTEELDVFTG